MSAIKTLKIGRKSFNLDALKGISKSKFLKVYGTEEEYSKLESFIKKDKK